MSERQTLYRPAIERMRVIAGLLRSGGRFSVQDTARRFEVNLKTIRRDIEFLRDLFGYDIQYDFIQRQWKLTSALEPQL